jgi:hypothetical protein
MEYGIKIDNYPGDLNTCFADGICDNNYVQHVGYSESNPSIRQYFSSKNINTISRKITQLLEGVDPHNRRIIVPNKTICSVMSSIYENFRPPTGDIYGRYNVPSGIGADSYVQSMIDQTIEVIVSDVRNNLETEENNSKLSIWTTVLGSFNENGLRGHPVIKTREKRPAPFQFNMNY